MIMVYCPICFWHGDVSETIRHGGRCLNHCPECWPRQAWCGICSADHVGTKASPWYAEESFLATLA